MPNNSSVKPFDQLKPEEMEVTKDECLFYLDLYYRFIKEVHKHPEETYINIFKRIRYGSLINVVNEVSCFNEYDYMIQFAEFFTISKFFSLLIDSNIEHLDDLVKNDYFDEKYYAPGSRKFTKKNLISLLRNAFNHNDKSSFELFRLIKSKKDIDMFLEIYLRRLNFHLKIGVKDLYDIFGEMLDAKSIYDFDFIDKNGNTFRTVEDIENSLDDNIKLKLKHLYNFKVDENNPNSHRITDSTPKDEYEKVIDFTDSQIKATKSVMKQLKSLYKEDALDMIPYVLRDNIPFGMSKIYGYSFDLNYLIRDLYNPKSSYKDFIVRTNGLSFRGNKLLEAEALYYSIVNFDNMVDRSFSLLASYVLDSVIPEDNPNFHLDGDVVDKTHYRNAFVHGRWYSYLDDSLKRQFALADYDHGDTEIMKSSLDNNESEITVSEEALYDSFKGFIKQGNFDLPLSLIEDKSGNGYFITFRVNGVNYCCNVSLTKKSPIFLLLGEKDGEIFTPYGDKFRLFEDMINQTNFDDLDPRMMNFIKKVPKLARKAFKTLITTKSEEEYIEGLTTEINELLDICTEIKMGIDPDSGIIHFHY